MIELDATGLAIAPAGAGKLLRVTQDDASERLPLAALVKEHLEPGADRVARRAASLGLVHGLGLMHGLASLGLIRLLASLGLIRLLASLGLIRRLASLGLLHGLASLGRLDGRGKWVARRAVSLGRVH